MPTTKRESKFRIVLRDANGFDICDREAESLREAKRLATYLLTDEFARLAEVTHERGDVETTVVLDQNDECVWDNKRVWQ